MISALAVIATVIAVLLLLHGGDPAAHSLFIRRTALALMVLSTALIGAFVIGDTFESPGGWLAAGLVALWLVPMAGLSALAWYRPRRSPAVLGVLITAAIGLAAWFAADPAGWRAFEDRTGPVRTLVTFALALPVALLGWRRPAVGGAMLVVLGLVPLAVGTVGSAFGAVSLAAIATPPVLTGLLYLVAVMIAHRRPRAGPAPGGPGGHRRRASPHGPAPSSQHR